MTGSVFIYLFTTFGHITIWTFPPFICTSTNTSWSFIQHIMKNVWRHKLHERKHTILIQHSAHCFYFSHSSMHPEIYVSRIDLCAEIIKTDTWSLIITNSLTYRASALLVWCHLTDYSSLNILDDKRNRCITHYCIRLYRLLSSYKYV